MKWIVTLVLATKFSFTFCQFVAGYHQSNIPFVSLGYEFADRVRPEVRLGTDTFLEDILIQNSKFGFCHAIGISAS